MKKDKSDSLLHVYNLANIHDLLKYVYVYVIFMPSFSLTITQSRSLICVRHLCQHKKGLIRK